MSIRTILVALDGSSNDPCVFDVLPTTGHSSEVRIFTH